MTKIALCGPGESGKDTIATIIAKLFFLRYCHSTSWYARSFVMEKWNNQENVQKIYTNTLEFYNDRRSHRRFWADSIEAFNKTDSCALYKRCLMSEDILAGIRRVKEINAVKKEKLVDLVIWINTFPLETKDETQEYGPELCDFTLDNPIGNLRKTTNSIQSLYGFVKSNVSRPAFSGSAR